MIWDNDSYLRNSVVGEKSCPFTRDKSDFPSFIGYRSRRINRIDDKASISFTEQIIVDCNSLGVLTHTFKALRPQVEKTRKKRIFCKWFYR